MRVVKTADIYNELNSLAPEAKLWVYNGYDCMCPQEILEKQLKMFNPRTQSIYDFERAMLGPAFSMMMGGVKVDFGQSEALKYKLTKDFNRMETYVNGLAIAVWGKGLNPNSPKQMQNFFYDMPANDGDPEGFGFEPIYTGSGRTRRITCGRDALEKLQLEYYAEPVVRAILCWKDLSKQIDFLNRGIDHDGRMRCSFNVAATDTGRWSSSKNPFGRGTNFQNITDELRSIFMPDAGYIFAYPDMAQAESRAVAYLSEDLNYINACESGDLHTTVAQMVWPDLEWTDNEKRNRAVADTIFYRHFSYRDMAKRGGHGTNYMGSAWTMAKHLRVDTEVMELFQRRYFEAFPGIREWHLQVQRTLQSSGLLITPFGRERTFFGRLDDDATLRQAVAHTPQSLVSDLVKLGTLRAWQQLVLAGDALIHGDVHDGCLWSLKTNGLRDSIATLKDSMTIGVEINNRVMTIPVEIKVGYRWVKEDMKTYHKDVLSELSRPDVIDTLLAIDISA